MREELARVQSLLTEARQLAGAAKTREALDKATEARSLAGSLDPQSPGAAEAAGAAAQELGVLYQRVNDPARALEMYREAETAMRRLPLDQSPHSRLLLAAALINLGGLLTRQRVYDDARSSLDEALTLLRDGGKDGAQAPAVSVMLLSALQNRAGVELEVRDLPSARASLVEALDQGEAVIVAAPQLLPQLIDISGRLIQVLKAMGEPTAAVSVAERSSRWAEAAYEAGAQSGPQLYVTTRFQLVDANVFGGHFAEAESHLWKALDMAATPQTLMLGADFYFTLLRCSEEQLERGDLPRSEIVEAVSEILSKMEDGQAPPEVLGLVRARFAVLATGRRELAEELLSTSVENPAPVLQQLRQALRSDVDWRIKRDAGV